MDSQFSLPYQEVSDSRGDRRIRYNVKQAILFLVALRSLRLLVVA